MPDCFNLKSICYTTLNKQFNKKLFHAWLTHDLKVKMNSNDIRSKWDIILKSSTH